VDQNDDLRRSRQRRADTVAPVSKRGTSAGNVVLNLWQRREVDPSEGGNPGARGRRRTRSKDYESAQDCYGNHGQYTKTILRAS
jgi:hypothetical protein